jgi:sulfatase maturation enzyme AslB (radical SAM superfamily)
LFLHYHVDTDKKSKLCCHTPYPLTDLLIDFNHSKYNQARQKVLNNEKLLHCDKCYEAEEEGFVSLRQRTIDDVIESGKTKELFSNIDLFIKDQEIDPLWYDLRISNNCNLSCRMCGPKYSSTWAQRNNEVNAHLGYEPDIEISPNAYKIQLAGGEPFMIKRFAAMLEKVKNKNCEIVVNTNGTIVTDALFDQLCRFKTVQIVLSLDGYSQLNNYIRRGSNWNTIVKNIGLFQRAGFNLLVNTVVQRDNVNHLSELGDFLQSVNIDDWLLSNLFEPSELRWENCNSIDFDNIRKTLNMHAVQRNEISTSLLETILKKEH